MRSSHRFSEGLIYFPLFTDITDNDKVQILLAEHGRDGFCFLIFLWASIYKKSYYRKWSSRERKLFCSNYNFTLYEVDIFINTCITEGLFDRELFEKFEILTSKRIQEIWVFITKRREKLVFTREWLLIDLKIVPRPQRIELVDIDNKQLRLPSLEKDSKQKSPKNKPSEKSIEPVTSLSYETTYEDIMSFISKPYDKLPTEIRNTYSYNEFVQFTEFNNRINQLYPGIRKSRQQITIAKYFAFLSNPTINVTAIELDQSLKKMAELGVKEETDISLRLEACLNMIRSPFVKPILVGANGSLLRDHQLENDILGFWEMDEIKFPNMQQKVVHFLNTISSANQLDQFKKQWNFFKQYKSETGKQYKGSLDNFIGSPMKSFSDAKWSTENWETKLKERQSKTTKKLNGTEVITAVAPAGSGPRKSKF